MREKNKTRRILFSGFAVMLSIWFIPMTVFAAKESRILQTVTNDDMIRCFVAGISEYDSVSAQIGQDGSRCGIPAIVSTYCDPGR